MPAPHKARLPPDKAAVGVVGVVQKQRLFKLFEHGNILNK
jgi:hypothetical protein